jgi:hypothetical protein
MITLKWNCSLLKAAPLEHTFKVVRGRHTDSKVISYAFYFFQNKETWLKWILEWM